MRFITKVKFKLQIWFLRSVYEFVLSKESDRVISKDLKDDMLKRIGALDAVIRVLTDVSFRRGGRIE